MRRPKGAKEVPAATRAALPALVKAGMTNRRVADPEGAHWYRM